ncbi:hypothetical protein ACFY1U_33085 [Streptomyces sp. NPDC001351]
MSRQISAGSAHSGSLTYAASGLPTGPSINSPAGATGTATRGVHI